MTERITDENGVSFTPEDFNKQWGHLQNPDEIVLENIKMIHLENMDVDSYWMGIYMKDGRIYHLNFGGINLKTYFKCERG